MKERTANFAQERLEASSAEPLERLLERTVAPTAPSLPGEIGSARIGTVVGFTKDSTVALVTYADQPGSAALPASGIIDVRAEHIGRKVVLIFEEGDPRRPLILGCVPDSPVSELPQGLPQVELEADGERLVLSAQRQVVLRCGKASITLTCDGKILLHGTYVSNRSTGVMRIKGGSVHLN